MLLHGLSATRRYVVMGSRLLERRGYRLIAYDARGHGSSTAPEDRGAYRYQELVGDLEAVLDDRDVERAVLAGSSMGAATAAAFALRSPDRVRALVLSTPAYAGPESLRRAREPAWLELVDAFATRGVDGFMEVFEPSVGPRWRDSVQRLTRQRLERHDDPMAVADALRVVPGSAPFTDLASLSAVNAPTLVVGSRDEADPEHPLEVAEAYVERLPDAELAVEEPGKPPLAWRGAHLSRAIAGFLERKAPDVAAAATAA